MSIEKQRLYNEIDTLPEELTNQVINFIEYLKISYVDTDAWKWKYQDENPQGKRKDRCKG